MSLNTQEKVLVTGSNGFIGGHLMKALRARYKDVIGVVRPMSGVRNLNSGQNVFLNLNDALEVKKIIGELNPSYVIHLASTKDRSSLSCGFGSSYRENVEISLNVIESCLQLPKFKGLIFLGSCDEYGVTDCLFDESLIESPMNSYGLSKLTITKILSSLHKAIQFPSIVLRPSVVYGPNQGLEMFLPALIRSLFNGDEFAMTNGSQTRDFIYVDDLVSSIIKILDRDLPLSHSILNIGSGLSQNIRQVALTAANLIHPSAHELLKFGAIKYGPNDVMNYSVDITRAKKYIDWEPKVGLEEGLSRLINFYQSTGDS